MTDAHKRWIESAPPCDKCGEAATVFFGRTKEQRVAACPAHHGWGMRRYARNARRFVAPRAAPAE